MRYSSRTRTSLTLAAVVAAFASVAAVGPSDTRAEETVQPVIRQDGSGWVTYEGGFEMSAAEPVPAGTYIVTAAAHGGQDYLPNATFKPIPIGCYVDDGTGERAGSGEAEISVPTSAVRHPVATVTVVGVFDVAEGAVPALVCANGSGTDVFLNARLVLQPVDRPLVDVA